MALARRAHQFRLVNSDGSEDNPAHAPIEPVVDRRLIPQSAAQLRRNRDRAQNGLDRCGIDGLARESTVEVNEMEPAEARIFELLGLIRRCRREHGRGLHVAAQQTNAAPVLEIDSWVKDQA